MFTTRETRHTTLDTEIAAIRDAFKIPEKMFARRVPIEVSKHPAWEHARCDITGTPAAIEIHYISREGGTTSILACAAEAAEQITLLDTNPDIDGTEGIYIEVAYAWLRHNTAAHAAAA